jgi:hypothetical protein
MAGTWYYSQFNQKVGPFSWGQLRQLATFGLLQRTDHVWEEGTAKWREASTVEGLFPRERAAKEYRLALGGQSVGPFSGEQIRTFLMSGRLPPETPARATDMSQWVPLKQLSEFAGYVLPATGSQAVLVVEKPAAEMSKEEAELHLAGKQGDQVARLISRLMDLRRKCAHNPSLEQSLDKNIKQLLSLRSQELPKNEAKPGSR